MTTTDETTQEPTRAPLDEKALRDLIASWREREESLRGNEDQEARVFAAALADCASDLEQMTAATFGGEHKCAFPCNPPGGTFWAPGPCRICGKTYERAQAERQLAEAQAAMKATA